MYANHSDLLNDESSEVEQQDQPTKRLTSKITTYLRWVGSILIILSAISFMLQGNDEILPAYRYWIGLGLTLLLCAGGLVCAYLFNETKGARIFFGLGTAFLPVQVTQVSAMIYAYWHGQDAMQPQYSWLQFMDVSPGVIAFDFVITGLLLVLVSYASYSMLARKHFKALLVASVVGNILLLIPFRDGNLIPIIIAGLFLFLRQIEHRLIKDSTMRLPEGMAARALISLPLLIIIGRSLLHPFSYLMAIVISAIVVIYSIVDIKRYTQSTTILHLGQWLGTLSAMGIWMIVVEQFSLDSTNNPSTFLPIAIILFVLSEQVDFHARLYRTISALLALGLTYSSMIDQHMLAPVVTIGAGILLTIAGIKYREKLPLIIGNICVTGGLLFYWEYAFNMYANAPWISSIGLGLAVILLASYIENIDKQIIDKSRHYFNELKNWD